MDLTTVAKQLAIIQDYITLKFGDLIFYYDNLVHNRAEILLLKLIRI